MEEPLPLPPDYALSGTRVTGPAAASAPKPVEYLTRALINITCEGYWDVPPTRPLYGTVIVMTGRQVNYHDLRMRDHPVRYCKLVFIMKV
jgi:hypothetical protein